MNQMKTGLLAILIFSLWSCEDLNLNGGFVIPQGTSTVTVTISPCSDGDEISFGLLPQAIQDYLSDNYPGVEVDDIEQFLVDNVVSYGVELENDVEILFDADGLVISAGNDNDEDDIPVSALPASIVDYVAANYPDSAIIHAEWEFEYGQQYYEVYLEGNLELYFDTDGNFLCLDDSPGNDDDDDDGDDDDGDDDDGDDDDGDDDDGDDDDGANLSAEVLAAIQAYVNQTFSAYHIDEIELEDWCDDQVVVEVELEGPGSNEPDLYFDLGGTYLWMTVDIAPAGLPAAVTATLEATYPGYTFQGDDIERVEYPDGAVGYRVKIDAPGLGDDLEIVFDAQGAIECTDD